MLSSGLEIFEEAGLVDLLGGTMYGANLMAGGGTGSLSQKSGLASLKSEDGGCGGCPAEAATPAAINPPEVAEVNKGLIAAVGNTEVVTGELEGFGDSGLLQLLAEVI